MYIIDASDVQIKCDGTRTIKFSFHLYLFKSSLLSQLSCLTETRLFDFRLKRASAKVHGFSQSIGNVFPLLLLSVSTYKNDTPKLDSIAPRPWHNDREYAVKQRNLKVHPKIYDSTIDVYDREDFGKALRRHDAQIIPAALLLLFFDVSSFVVCFLLFRLDDPSQNQSSLAASVVRDELTDEIPFRRAVPCRLLLLRLSDGDTTFRTRQ